MEVEDEQLEGRTGVEKTLREKAEEQQSRLTHMYENTISK